MHQDNGCSGRGRDTLPVQVQMNKEAARPSVCTHTEPKTLVWTPQERNPNITPAPSTDTCGQCHSTDKRGAGGRDRHRASPRTTQTPKPPTASPNAGCGCRQHRIPSCRRHMPRQFPVRTHTPKIQNTLRPYKCYIFVRSPRWGCCAGSSDLSAFQNWEPPASAGAAEIKKRRPHRRLFLWNNSFSDVPLPIPHGSPLPSA